MSDTLRTQQMEPDAQAVRAHLVASDPGGCAARSARSLQASIEVSSE